MKKMNLLKSLFVTVFVFAANLTVFANSPETELIYNTEEIDGVKMSETVYKMNEGILTNFEKYNYKYNDSNQLIKRTNAKIWSDPGTTYSYDKDGNLIQECDKTNSADPVTYEYTAENRLAAVKQGGVVLMASCTMEITTGYSNLITPINGKTAMAMKS